MLIAAFRLALSLLAPELTEDGQHEQAHVLCERAVYATLAPDAPDDATTPLGERVATLLCRYEAPGETWAR